MRSGIKTILVLALTICIAAPMAGCSTEKDDKSNEEASEKKEAVIKPVKLDSESGDKYIFDEDPYTLIYYSAPEKAEVMTIYRKSYDGGKLTDTERMHRFMLKEEQYDHKVSGWIAIYPIDDEDLIFRLTSEDDHYHLRESFEMDQGGLSPLVSGLGRTKRAKISLGKAYPIFAAAGQNEDGSMKLEEACADKNIRDGGTVNMICIRFD
jgi:hypothetical protein